MSPRSRRETINKCSMLHMSGWKREIVVRGVQDSGSAVRRCDVYYYTPENTKLVCDSLVVNLSCVAMVS